MTAHPSTPAEGGRATLARASKAGIDESAITAYDDAVSLPVAPGPRRRRAVEIVDDREIESLEIEG